jgi:hypothetical protein
MKVYLKTFPTSTNVIGFQSHLKKFNFLILVTEVDLLKGSKQIGKEPSNFSVLPRIVGVWLCANKANFHNFMVNINTFLGRLVAFICRVVVRADRCSCRGKTPSLHFPFPELKPKQLVHN